MRYEFRSASGAMCCASDDINNLCEHCRAEAEKRSAIPDGYADALNKLGAAPPESGDPFGVPADGYQIALAKETR